MLSVQLQPIGFARLQDVRQIAIEPAEGHPRVLRRLRICLRPSIRRTRERTKPPTTSTTELASPMPFSIPTTRFFFPTQNTTLMISMYTQFFYTHKQRNTTHIHNINNNQFASDEHLENLRRKRNVESDKYIRIYGMSNNNYLINTRETHKITQNHKHFESPQ